MRGNNDEQSNNNKKNDNQDLAPKLKKKMKKSNFKHINRWKYSDLPVFDNFEWNLLIFAFSSLFEKFVTDDILQFICKESVRYAQSKGSHSYKLELHDLKAFTAIRFIRGYVNLPRRPMI